MFEGLRGLCRATSAAMLVFAVGFADARAIAQPPPPPPPAVAGYGGRYTIFDVSTPSRNDNCLAVAGLGGDVIVMQEVWNERYKRSLRDELPDYHVMFSGSHYGLVTLIKKSAVVGIPVWQELNFPTQRFFEHLN